MSKENKSDLKGKANGYCNRSACLSPNKVIYHNRANDKYYCKSCAFSINHANAPYDNEPLCTIDFEAEHYDKQEQV